MENRNKVLHLVLKRKWWDLIKSGRKLEEYRVFSPYWRKRFLISESPFEFVPYKLVTFHLGYTNTTMTFYIKSIRYDYGNVNYGAPYEPCFIISLGHKLL